MVDFEMVYSTYFRDVELYLLALCKEPMLAEELTAQVFFKALKALPKFRGECDIRTWLFSMARNCFFTEMRKKRNTVPLEDLSIPDPGCGVEEMLMDKQQAMQLHKLLHDLPEPYKEVFSLRVFGQLSFADIGSLFGKNQNWACVTYHRARQRIKDALEVRE